MKFISFLKSKTFFANLVLASLLIAGLLFGLNYFLDSYSRHGENIKVTNLNALALSEVDKILSEKGLFYEVIDSSEYDPLFPRGSVMGQYPEAGASVKVGRSIRITINPFNPRKIEMPMLVEKTKRRAIYDLESQGFVVGNLIYVPYIGKDVVIEVKIGDRSVMPGEKLNKGTIIDLVLGQGLSDELIPSPYLRWKTLEEAREDLLARSLNLGSIIYDEVINDTAAALVYRQSPPPSLNPSIQMGREIDLWLTNDYTKITNDSLEFRLQTPPDSILNDSVL